MNVPRAFLAAVGAFWSELIPAPSLWDYEGAALAEAEEGVEVWDAPRCPVWGSDCKCDRSPEVTCSALHDSDDLLGREPSHADYDDEPPVRGCARCNTPLLMVASQLVPGMFCSARCVELAEAAVTVSADEPPGGIEVPALPPGLPFTFDADELVGAARGILLNYYPLSMGDIAHGAAELVVSQLITDLTAAYTEAQK